MNSNTPLALEVGSTSFSTPSDREIRVRRSFQAPRPLVFEAWTRPEHLPRWMTGPGGWTMTTCEVDLRPSGAWHLAWRHDTCGEMAIGGAYREILAPERVVSTESWGGDWPETVNTASFAEEHGVTTLTKTILYPSKEARDAALGTGMKEGMAASLDNLESLLHELAPAA